MFPFVQHVFCFSRKLARSEFKRAVKCFKLNVYVTLYRHFTVFSIKYFFLSPLPLSLSLSSTFSIVFLYFCITFPSIMSHSATLVSVPLSSFSTPLSIFLTRVNMKQLFERETASLHIHRISFSAPSPHPHPHSHPISTPRSCLWLL